MNSTEELNILFKAVGKEHGYDTVTAEFCEFKEFKVKWKRSCGWAEFEVSDYVKGAPAEVLTGLAQTIFSRLAGRCERNYPKAMLDWITSDDFVRSRQPVYLMRARNMTKDACGEYKDLNGSYQRLIDLGLVHYDRDLVLTWTRTPNVKRIGYCSVLMKVIVISSVFDSPAIPDHVADYVLYHELIHLNKGFDPFGQRHGIDFRVLESLYPRRDEAEEYLRKLRLFM